MDGTLTPPRLPMTEDFAETFVPWLANHKAFIATGSDFAKVKEQLPDSVINLDISPGRGAPVSAV